MTKVYEYAICFRDPHPVVPYLDIGFQTGGLYEFVCDEGPRYQYLLFNHEGQDTGPIAHELFNTFFKIVCFTEPRDLTQPSTKSLETGIIDRKINHQ